MLFHSVASANQRGPEDLVVGAPCRARVARTLEVGLRLASLGDGNVLEAS